MTAEDGTGKRKQRGGKEEGQRRAERMNDAIRGVKHV